MDKLTKAEGAGKSSDDCDSVFGISAELKQNRREGVPLALQLQKQHSTWINMFALKTNEKKNKKKH